MVKVRSQQILQLDKTVLFLVFLDGPSEFNYAFCFECLDVVGESLMSGLLSRLGQP